ncbi:MAG: ammonium transporter, Amt family [Deferribacteres bacterium]|jgi:Amt family ammonium transporter|nr:ammonium transporter [Deferribacteraceae bacterium]MDK2792961.1 ammonium transporter, Amt family [Deferribacteres bacterium]
MKKFILTILLSAIPLSLFAAEPNQIDGGDTAWMIVATALVMFMTPAGLALFYGGMTRTKNILNTIGMSFVSYAIASLLWVIILFSLSFGSDIGGIIGGFDYVFFKNIKVTDVEGGIPKIIFAVFQMTFAGITVALISGSIVERVKFGFWVIFSTLWLILVYAPVAHWVWGGGFIGTKIGALDFAGGTVVHINAGVSGLVLALLAGKRRDYGRTAIIPSSIVLTVLGAGMLWFGWFGFNAGSQLAADGIAANAFLVTNTSAAAGALSWLLIEQIVAKKPTMLGAASGAVAGLVAITPAAGFVSAPASIIFGILSGILGFIGVFVIKSKLKYDDSLDAFGVHGLCGILGAVLTGVFANPEINEAGVGLLYGNPSQVWAQVVSIIITVVYSGILTVIIFYITKIFVPVRVEDEDEIRGLDEVEHGERGFNI